jgi:hypothetical protein
VDAGIWIAIQHNASNLNHFLSRFVLPVVLLSELWVNYACAICLGGRSRSRVWEAILIVFSMVMFVSWFLTCKQTTTPLTTTMVQNTTVLTDERLMWCNEPIIHLGQILFFILLVGPFLYAFPNGNLRGIVLATILLTFLHSYSRDDFGAHWCWTSNIIAVLIFVELCFCPQCLSKKN